MGRSPRAPAPKTPGSCGTPRIGGRVLLRLAGSLRAESVFVGNKVPFERGLATGVRSDVRLGAGWVLSGGIRAINAPQTGVFRKVAGCGGDVQLLCLV